MAARRARQQKSAKKEASIDLREVEEEILFGRESHKRHLTDKLDRFIFWSAIVILTKFNITGIMLLIPLFIFLDGPAIFGSIAFFGLMSGFLFNMVIMGIEHLEEKHHFTLKVLIPMLALLDMALIYWIYGRYTNPSEFSLDSLVLLCLAYIASFMLPYIISLLSGRYRYGG